MGVLSSIVKVLMFIVKAIFGMKKPQDNTIFRPEQDIPVSDGKTDKERLKDLGL